MGTDNGNFPLEISTRSTNFFPYFWDLFVKYFFVCNNIRNNSLNYFFFFGFGNLFYLIFTLNNISRKIKIKIHKIV